VIFADKNERVVEATEVLFTAAGYLKILSLTAPNREECSEIWCPLAVINILKYIEVLI
jgi:hypothetical protein